MSQIQPPPTYAEVVLTGTDGRPFFNPIWLSWFIDLAAVISSSGGSGGTIQHNSLGGIQGGTANEYYHLDASDYTLLTARANLYKPTAQSVTSSTVLVNDANLYWSIGANQTWMFRSHVKFSAAIKTTGIQVNLAVPAGASGYQDLQLVTDATSGNECYVPPTSAIGTTVNITTSLVGGGATRGAIDLFGFVTSGATAGAVNFQWAQSTSSTSPLTAAAGSQLIATRVA